MPDTTHGQRVEKFVAVSLPPPSESCKIHAPFDDEPTGFARPSDVALEFSTRGASRNLLAAMHEAKSRGLYTIAMSGADGGDLARSPAVDVCVTVASEHLPRIQEAHATAWHALLAVAQEQLA